jgi:glycosyltransferase involved in cell wall biosynthesis
MDTSQSFKQSLFSDTKFLNADGYFSNVPVEILWNQSNPICSVIIPCFNYGTFLMEAIHSAQAQTLNNIEIIVVDDGSTDQHTKEVLSSLIGNPYIKLILKPNEGLPEARNTGIRMATGKYICCLDADDLLHPSYLEHCVYHLEKDGHVGFVYSWAKLFGTENSIWKTRDFNIEDAMLDNHTCVSAVFRKSDWLLAGQYDRRMDIGYEDWEFWLRLGQLGRKGVAIKSPLFLHRRHGRTMTHVANDHRDFLIDKIKTLNSRLYHDTSWKNIIHAALTLSDRQSPDMLMGQQTIQKSSLLCVMPWLQPAGSEILMFDVLKKLSDDFHICIITTLEDTHALSDTFKKITNDIFHCSYDDSLEDFVEFIDYLSITRNASSIITSGSVKFYDALPLLHLKRPETFRVVDIIHNDSELGHKDLSIKYNDYLAGTIGISQRIVDTLIQQGKPTDKVRCILNGVDGHNLFRPLTTPTIKDLHSKVPVIGFIGRASEEKRPHIFIELIKALSTSMPVKAVMISDGPLKASLIEQITMDNLENISLVPGIDRAQLPDVYRQFDVFVNVSSIEGMPLTVVEALACGCPVAAMDVGNLNAIIMHQDNGILVAKDDFDALVEALTHYFNNPEVMVQMKLRARASYEHAKLDANTMLDAYSDYLNRCFRPIPSPIA